MTRKKFKELAAASGVDVAANRKLASEVCRLEEEAGDVKGSKRALGCLMTIAFAAAAVALLWLFLSGQGVDAKTEQRCVACTFIGLAAGCLIIPFYRSAGRRLANLREQIRSGQQRGWEQMSSLNSLYTWDMTVKLIEETVPRLEFDPYFTAGRLAQLRRQFGWDDSFNDGKSMLFAQSGVINGNPFVFGQYLEMEWGSKTYEGTRDISWTTYEEDEDGKRRPVRHHETLHAYVTKPIPEYTEQKMLVYGNDAAPNLSFSREPSGLTGRDNALGGRIKKMWRLKELKEFSRNLDDDSNFTLMANHEFETWFHAKDRDDEVEFRLLFTPVAQTQMLALMKDDKTGYGDDFAFVKRCKINILLSQHLNAGEIDTDPSRFRNWNFDDAESTFQSFNERYFKDVYFALAPLLAIPLYQQTRTHDEIWKDVLKHREASSWEHEAIANYHGYQEFMHPKCITRCILKTKTLRREDGESVVAVTAQGYRGEDRVTYKEVWGGDGEFHDVPVEWTEYLPVSRTSNMCVREGSDPSNRRSILSFLEKTKRYG